MASSFTPLDDASLSIAVHALCLSEPRFRPVVLQHGMPSLRAATGGLEGLLVIVTEQFLSLHAAQAIWIRVAKRLQSFDVETVLSCSQEELLALGLSRAKAKSYHGIAMAFKNQQVNADALACLTDAEVFKQLVALPGIGPWTADVYLLSCLLRPDVWPWGDVALQASAQALFGLAARPGKREMLEIGERFRPHRAVAARLLWSHYRGLKNLGQA